MTRQALFCIHDLWGCYKSMSCIVRFLMFCSQCRTPKHAQLYHQSGSPSAATPSERVRYTLSTIFSNAIPTDLFGSELSDAGALFVSGEVLHLLLYSHNLQSRKLRAYFKYGHATQRINSAWIPAIVYMFSKVKAEGWERLLSQALIG